MTIAMLAKICIAGCTLVRASVKAPSWIDAGSSNDDAVGLLQVSAAGSGVASKEQPANDDDDDTPLVQQFDPENTTSAMHPGNKKNFHTTLPVPVEGVWWIRWFPQPENTFIGTRLAVTFYNALKIEELYSFAGMLSNSTTFPAQVICPSGAAHHWGFSNSLVSRVGQIFAATSGLQGLHIDFHNETFGVFVRDPILNSNTWTFENIDDKQWARPTYFAHWLNPFNLAPVTYTATKVIHGDGTRTEYFDDYVKQMGNYKVRVFASNDQCKRRCDAIASVLTFWETNSWSFCKRWFCSDESADNAIPTTWKEAVKRWKL